MLDHLISHVSALEMMLKSLVGPSPNLLLLVACLVDESGDTHPHVKTQHGEATFEQQGASQQRISTVVHRTDELGGSELVVPDEVASGLPHSAGLWRAGSLAADHSAVHVKVPVGRTYLAWVVVDFAIAQRGQRRN